MSRSGSRAVRVAAILAVALSCACQPLLGPQAPRRYLVITHPALNRVTFFDLDADQVVGVLPAQKLPHDMLLSPDRSTLYVVNSGAQCITTYHLEAPELWREARAFMRRDTARAGSRGGAMLGMGVRADSAAGQPPRASANASEPHPRVAVPDSAKHPPVPGETRRDDGLTYLNPEPVQSLPSSVAEFHLTEATFPDTARAAHARVGAEEHRACFDCHERSLGAKPFGASVVMPECLRKSGGGGWSRTRRHAD